MKEILEEMLEKEELLKKLEIGLKQCQNGEGITTEELKEKLKKINKKYKKVLTNLK